MLIIFPSRSKFLLIFYVKFFFTFNAHESHSREAASLFWIHLKLCMLQPSTVGADRIDYDFYLFTTSSITRMFINSNNFVHVHNKVQLKATLNETLRFWATFWLQQRSDTKKYTAAYVVLNGNQKSTQSKFYRSTTLVRFLCPRNRKSTEQFYWFVCLPRIKFSTNAAHITAIMFSLLCIDYHPLSLPFQT